MPKFCFDVPHPWLLEAALQRLAAACVDPNSRALVGRADGALRAVAYAHVICLLQLLAP